MNVVPLRDVAVGPVRTPLLVLFGAGLFVLLIGCANVGNLVLARGIARRRELAVRSALGAGQGRLVRQLLTESISLALIAGLLGSVLAFWGSEFLVASLSQRFPLPEIPFNWALLAFACVIAILSGALSGVPLALMVMRGGQAGGRTQHRLGNLLLVAETTLTVMLLIGAGLLVKSFIWLQRVELGVDPRQALSADLILSKRYVDPERREVYVQQLLDSVGASPGVQNVAVHADPPFTGGGWRETFTVDGHADPRPDRGHAASFNAVRGRFFQAMGIPITRGRDFDPQDTATSPPVAVINETMARQFWPEGDAIGKRLRFYYDKNPRRWLSIVGVVRDVRYHGRFSEPVPQVFVPGQQPFYKAQEPYISLVVRTVGEPAALLTAVQARIWAVDKDQPIAKLQPMNQTLWESAAAPRVYMLLLGTFAAIALVIASAGIYGINAYAVARRTQEIGIRLALGATRGQIVAMVLRRGLLLLLVGAGLGVAGTRALTQVMSGLLYGITPTDTPTFLAVLLLFTGVALVSTYLPARRAAAIDPTLAVRYE